MSKVTFKNINSENLSAKLDKPEGDIKAYALFAHCFTCTKDVFAASRISKTLQEKNIAVLRFDFTGLGASEGDFANTNFSSNVKDLICAANFMRDEFEAPSILIGHSFGGSAVLVAAHDIPEVKAVATLCAPSDISHVAHHFEDAIEEIEQHGEAEVQLVGRPFKIKKHFLDDISNTNLENYVANLNKALLVMHPPLDNTVSVTNASNIFGWAKHPKSFISLDTADHLITQAQDAEYAGNLIASWSKRYLG